LNLNEVKCIIASLSNSHITHRNEAEMSGEIPAIATSKSTIRTDGSFYGNAKSESGFHTYRYESSNYAVPHFDKRPKGLGLYLVPSGGEPRIAQKAELLTILPLNSFTAKLWCFRDDWEKAKEEINLGFKSE